VPDPPGTDDPLLIDLATARIDGADNHLGEELVGSADLTGDGVDDLAATADDRDGIGDGVVLVYGAPLADTLGEGDAAAAIYGPQDGSFGTALVADGDVDGDGLADLLVGADSSLSGGGGYAYLLRGPLEPELYAEDAALSLTTQEDTAHVGRALAGPGDLDGDGAPDLAVGASGQDRVVLLAGDEAGALDLEDVARTALDGGEQDIGGSLASAGDLDGDGLGDLAIPSQSGDVWILSDPPEGTVALHDVASRLVAPEAYGSTATVTPLGDRDGDGYADLAINLGSGFDGLLVVAPGPAVDGADLSAAPASLDGTAEALARTGDTDGDGVADLSVACQRWSYYGFDAWVVQISGAWEGALSCDLLDGRWSPEAGSVRTALASGADLDGDGADDLLLGADDTVWLIPASAL